MFLSFNIFAYRGKNMTKALTITPKITNNYKNYSAQVAKKSLLAADYVPLKPKSKATRGLVGHIIDAFKVVLGKISNPQDALTKFSKGVNLPSHKDPAAIVIKTMHG